MYLILSFASLCCPNDKVDEKHVDDGYDEENHDDSDACDKMIQVIVFTECEGGGGGFSFVRKSKIEGEVFGEAHHIFQCFYLFSIFFIFFFQYFIFFSIFYLW